MSKDLNKVKVVAKKDAVVIGTDKTNKLCLYPIGSVGNSCPVAEVPKHYLADFFDYIREYIPAVDAPKIEAAKKRDNPDKQDNK